MIKIIFIFYHLIIGFFLALYILYINDKAKKNIIKKLSKKLLHIFQIDVETNENLHKILSKKNYLIVSNHISWLDIFLINSIYPVTFLSKADVTEWPLVGKLIKSADTIYINRDKKKSLSIASVQIEDELKQLKSVYFFPESIATDGSKLLPFKSNFFQTAINTQVDILPIAIKYTYQDRFSASPSYAGDITLLQSILTLVKNKNLKASIFVLPKISSKNNRKIIANKAREMIYKALN